MRYSRKQRRKEQGYACYLLFIYLFFFGKSYLYIYLFFRTRLTTKTKWFDLQNFRRLMRRKVSNKLTNEIVIAEFKAMPPTTLHRAFTFVLFPE